MPRVTFIAVTLKSGTQLSTTITGDYDLAKVEARLLNGSLPNAIARILELEVMPQLRKGVGV